MPTRQANTLWKIAGAEYAPYFFQPIPYSNDWIGHVCITFALSAVNNMSHILDNPAWNALISGNKSLANGTGTAKYFSPEVSFFAGIPAFKRSNFEELHDTISFDKPVAICTSSKMIDPQPWQILHRVDGFQMLYAGRPGQQNENIYPEPLTEIHVPEMIALTKLTKPGPFTEQTILFGHYEGVFRNNRLIAMAGQRLHCFNNIEISAVCTHPDYLGRGYARALIMSQVLQIREQAALPCLHVRQDNTRAIKVYESMGFQTSREMIFYILKKPDLKQAISGAENN